MSGPEPQPPAVRVAAPRDDNCTQTSPALAPVIRLTLEVLASLWMTSVNAADRGATSSHHFCFPMADACCQTAEKLLSFVTFPLQLPQTWTPTNLSLYQKLSCRLVAALCRPGIVCRLTQAERLHFLVMLHSKAFECI